MPHARFATCPTILAALALGACNGPSGGTLPPGTTFPTNCTAGSGPGRYAAPAATEADARCTRRMITATSAASPAPV